MESRAELAHYGIQGMKWGVRRYQNYDGTLTSAGKARYGSDDVRSNITREKRITGEAKEGSMSKRGAAKKPSSKSVAIDTAPIGPGGAIEYNDEFDPTNPSNYTEAVFAGDDAWTPLTEEEKREYNELMNRMNGQMTPEDAKRLGILYGRRQRTQGKDGMSEDEYYTLKGKLRDDKLSSSERAHIEAKLQRAWVMPTQTETEWRLNKASGKQPTTVDELAKKESELTNVQKQIKQEEAEAKKRRETLIPVEEFAFTGAPDVKNYRGWYLLGENISDITSHAMTAAYMQGASMKEVERVGREMQSKLESGKYVLDEKLTEDGRLIVNGNEYNSLADKGRKLMRKVLDLTFY